MKSLLAVTASRFSGVTAPMNSVGMPAARPNCMSLKLSPTISGEIAEGLVNHADLRLPTPAAAAGHVGTDVDGIETEPIVCQ